MGSDNSLNAWFDPQNTQTDLRGYADINVHYSLGTDEGSNRVCPTGTVHIYNPAECQVGTADRQQLVVVRRFAHRVCY